MNFVLIIAFILVLDLLKTDAANRCRGLVGDDNSISIKKGGNYVLLLKHDPQVPIECYIENDSQKYSIDLFQSGIAPRLLPKGSNTIRPTANETEVMTSLGNGICGFKVDVAVSNACWNISFVDQARNTYHTMKRINIIELIPSHTVVYEKIGDTIWLTACEGMQNNMGPTAQCKLFNPQNQLVMQGARECKYRVEQSTTSDFGVWKCLIYYTSYMFPYEMLFEFIPKEFDIITTWTNASDNHVNIGCSVTNATDKPNYCAMVRPDGEQIIVRPALATKRYTAFETNFTQNKCALQIVLPLEESEKGLWRCEQNSNAALKSGIGGFINVSAESSTHKPEVKLPKGVFAFVNTTLELQCEVPFSSPYCYMRGPDGFMYPLNDHRQTSLGVCKFDKEMAQLTDNGTWMCGYGMQTGEPDAVYTFEVYIPEPVPIQPETQEVESRTAGVARLICTTRGLGNYPLKYCRFLSPDGIMYHIENRKTSDRISYDGRGLEYGDCGIVLQDVKESDQGTWTCITRLDTDIKSEEVYTNMHLTINDSLSIASTLGISFGVVIVVIFGAVFFIHRYQKRKNYQTNFNNADSGIRVSQGSNGSENQDDIFNVLQDNGGNRNYNATEVVVRYGTENNNPFGSGSDSDENNVVFEVASETPQQRV